MQYVSPRTTAIIFPTTHWISAQLSRLSSHIDLTLYVRGGMVTNYRHKNIWNIVTKICSGWTGHCWFRWRISYDYVNILRPGKVVAFHWRHFQVHFLEQNLLNFNYNFTEICSLWSNWQNGIIGSENWFAPDSRQAILWTNDGLGYWRIYA